MQAKILSATLHGLDAKIIDVEVDVHNGLPCTVIVGLADASIKESKERVRACLRNSEFYKYPLGRVSINLAPADIYKYGTQCDLAIAIGILCASKQIEIGSPNALFLGELSLSGVLRPVTGALAMVSAAKNLGIKAIFLPCENVPEARLVEGINIFGCNSVQEIIGFLSDPNFAFDEADICGSSSNYRITQSAADKTPINFFKFSTNDFSDISGQEFAKRGFKIAASGLHNILLNGPPGSGKTMLAESFASILPKPKPDQLLEIMKIHGACGLVKENSLEVPPLRTPHTSISLQGFIGGGRIAKPGEISLAHNGILFLDEFPEFPRNIIESLRQPLESGEIKIARTNGSYVFPARFILVAAQNPCPCGYFFDKNKCICTVPEVQKYNKKISGPILDRIDLHIEVEKVKIHELDSKQESSTEILEEVEKARAIQAKRFAGKKLNGRMDKNEIQKFCILKSASKDLLYHAEQKFSFSARTYFRILKVARTIADLEGSEDILEKHIAESLRYRLRE